ncbi:MAG: hypothetical protein H6815_01810 [Phycisphaeraceae bacterium]|nr:hypothetical protein [Phycisphaerales bacterium]MCB9859164.1 hypothetical protein [Phycisphaeraceae bacterium]
MQRTHQPDLPRLCERCGYDVDSLSKDQVCPECGSSVDGVRTGSAWQQQPSLGSWLKTNTAVVLHPLRTFSNIIPEHARSTRLLWINSFVTALCFAVIPMLPGPSRSGLRTWLTHSSSTRIEFVVSGAVLVLGTLAVAGLSHAESLGFRLIGKRRKWRITPDVARSIVSHASIGWLIFAVVTIGLMIVANQIADNALRHGSGEKRLYLMFMPVEAALLGAGLSLLCFETLAYIGLLRCRYANGHSPVV